jgi:hypothetical protein
MKLAREQALSILNARQWSFEHCADTDSDFLISPSPKGKIMIADVSSSVSQGLLFFLGSKDNQSTYFSNRSLLEKITFKTDPVMGLFNQIKTQLMDEKIRTLTAN